MFKLAFARIYYFPSSYSVSLRLRHSYVHCLARVHLQSFPDRGLTTARGINDAARTQLAQVFTLLEHDASRLSFTHSDMRLSGVHRRHGRG